MKKHPAIFLDRDGTIIDDAGHIKNPADVVFYPYTVDSLKMLQQDHQLFIITNQSGIAKGLVSEKEVQEVNRYILDYLRSNDIVITELFYCPHKTEDMCQCKKPSPYFIFEAERLYDIDLSRSYIIGDHPSDAECGINAGIKPFYLLTGHGRKHLHELTPGIQIFENLFDCTKAIIKL